MRDEPRLVTIHQACPAHRWCWVASVPTEAATVIIRAGGLHDQGSNEAPT